MKKEEMDTPELTRLRVEIIKTRLARLKDYRWLRSDEEVIPADVKRAKRLVWLWERKQSRKSSKRRKMIDDAMDKIREELAFGRLDAALRLLKKFEAKFQGLGVE